MAAYILAAGGALWWTYRLPVHTEDLSNDSFHVRLAARLSELFTWIGIVMFGLLVFVDVTDRVLPRWLIAVLTAAIPLLWVEGIKPYLLRRKE